MITRRSSAWELVLADLALILFLVTLSALASEEEEGAEDIPPEDRTVIAPSQALYRPTPSGPTIEEWLEERPADPRATLTIVGLHSGADEMQVWREVRALAQGALGKGFPVRVVIARGRERDIYASLAYDAQVAAR